MGDMLIEAAINKRGDAKIAILHQGVDTNICALDMIEEIIMLNNTSSFDLELVKMVANTVENYIVTDPVKGKIYRRMMNKFGVEVSRHYKLQEHMCYEVPDDFFNALDVMNRKELLTLRDRIYEVIDEAHTWDQFKDHLLAMEAAKSL